LLKIEHLLVTFLSIPLIQTTALQCVYSYLPAHMEFLGFQRDEIRMLTMIASLVSIIGPLIVGFILDRVSINRPASYGKWLRVLLFICFVATGIFFGLLLSITPESYDVVDKRSSATFSCNENGGRLFVKRYLNESCDNVVEREGHLQLINCTYTCEMPGSFKNLNNPLVVTQHKAYPLLEKLQDGTQFSSEATPSDEEDYDENKSYDDENLPQPEAFRVEPTQPSHIHPPHICVSNGTNVNCLAYLDDSVIRLNSVEVSDDANRFDNNFCKRSLSESFT
jgi:MFS_1 like family